MNGDRAKRAADVVVVGGGVVGLSTALHLQRTGHQVVIVERNTPGSGASGHNGGVFNTGECLPTGTPGVLRSIPRQLVDPSAALVVRYRYVPRLAPWLIRFIRASSERRVESISAALQQLTNLTMDGYDPLIRGTKAGSMVLPGGVLMAYGTQRSFAGDVFSRELRTRRGDTFQVLDNAEITALDPVLAGRFARAVYRPTPHFTLEPRRFVELLAAQFEAQGGVICRAEVTRLEGREGRVQGVLTTSGKITAETVVIAAGAWSRRLLRQLDFDVPLDTERGYGVYLPRADLRLTRPLLLQDFHIGLTSACDGRGVQLTGLDELASPDAPARYSVTRRMLRGATSVFPELRTEGAVPWMHCRPSMPDSLPVIGTVPGYPNAYLAFGHGHKGFALGGITGELVRQLIDGDAPQVDLEPYSPLRFSRRRRRAALTAAAVG